MRLDLALTGEALVAAAAAEGLLAAVYPRMRHQSGLASESLATQRAGKRLLPGVRAAVRLQVFLFDKRLIAH